MLNLILTEKREAMKKLYSLIQDMTPSQANFLISLYPQFLQS